MKYKITQADYLEANRLAAGAIKWFLIFALWCLVLLFAVRPGASPPEPTNWIVIATTAGVLAVAVFFGVTVGLKRQLLRVYAQQKPLHEEQDLSFDDAAILWKSASGTFKLKWRDVHKHKENAHMILVYQSQALMHIVPKRAFPDADLLNEFLVLLRSRGGQCAAQPPCDPQPGHAQGAR